LQIAGAVCPKGTEMQFHPCLRRTAIAAVFTLSGSFGVSSQAIEVAFPPVAVVVPKTVEPGSQELRIIVDFAAILYIEGGMSVVAVGNPAIADANLVNQRTVIVSGLVPGTTNVVALDVAGRILAEVLVYVSSQKPGMVRERRGTQVKIRNCIAGLCDVGPSEPALPVMPLGVAAGS
jgi:hypothetical protein